MCTACLQRGLQRLLARPFAALYDGIMDATERHGLSALRDDLLGGLHGDVVEIGAGTGVNLGHYGDGIRSLTLLEPEGPMAGRLRARVASSGREATVLQAPAEHLPLPDDSADVVVCTLVLCTVRDPAAALAEVRRVLRPGGRFVFVEHVRAPDEDPATQRLQRWVEPIWSTLGGGCHLTRDTAASIEAAGLRFTALHPWRMPKAPRFVKPAIHGEAVPA